MLQAIARGVFRITSWTLRDELSSEVEQCVMVGAPHTSAWDFPCALLLGAATDFDFRWVGKQALFRPPFGPLLRALGGVPVVREGNHDYVAQLAALFERNDNIALGITPEGTRSRTSRWKTGFYYIARRARVPIVLGYADYQRRELGFGTKIDSDLPKKQVMKEIREFYDGIVGYHPENYSPPKCSEDKDSTSE